MATARRYGLREPLQGSLLYIYIYIYIHIYIYIYIQLLMMIIMIIIIIIMARAPEMGGHGTGRDGWMDG